MVVCPSVRKAVIPAAGLGTRFLPVTKAVPKELLPLFDKPLIQYAVEEAVLSGIEEIILVTSEDKEPLEHYFQPHPQLEESLQGKVSPEMLEEVERLGKLARVSFVRQEQPLGLGHAVLTAREQVGDEAFAVILPDDVVFHETPALAQMLEVYHRRGAGVIAVEEVPPERVSSYGVIDPEALVRERVQDSGAGGEAAAGRGSFKSSHRGPIHPAPGGLSRPGADNARRQGGDSTYGRLGSSARIPPPICL